MDERRKTSRTQWVAAIALVVLPLLYVASIGPATRLCQDGVLHQGTLDVVYAPLYFALSHAPQVIRGIFVQYLMLWGFRIPDF